MKSSRRQTERLIKYWWSWPILGILFAYMGAVVISKPATSYVVLVFSFAFTFLISGISRTIFALTNRDYFENWGWYLGGGILDLFLGGLLLTPLGVAGTTLPFIVGFFLLFGSLWMIGAALAFKSYKVEGRNGPVTGGILGLISSVFLLLNPVLGVSTIIVWTALGFLVNGLSYIYLGFSFHKVHDYLHV